MSEGSAVYFSPATFGERAVLGYDDKLGGLAAAQAYRPWGGRGLHPGGCSRSCRCVDAVWASLKASGASVADPLYQETAREVTAKFIIQTVKNGEREERALIEGALLQLANLRRHSVANPPVRQS
jgi:hypothetical protein